MLPQPMEWWERAVAEWRQQKGFITSKENFMEKLMLVVTEVSEAAESFRTGEWDNVREEIADTFIRLYDLCGSIPELRQIESAIDHKMIKNVGRPWRHGKQL